MVTQISIVKRQIDTTSYYDDALHSYHHFATEFDFFACNMKLQFFLILLVAVLHVHFNALMTQINWWPKRSLVKFLENSDSSQAMKP